MAEASLAPVPLVAGVFRLPTQPGEQPYLIGSRCSRCGEVTFPQRPVCPRCKDWTMAEIPLSRRGRLYSFTVAYSAPAGWPAPYLQAFVQLPEGPRVFTLVSDCVEPAEDALRPGMEMELVIEPVHRGAEGSPLVTYKFRPVAPASEGARA